MQPLRTLPDHVFELGLELLLDGAFVGAVFAPLLCATLMIVSHRAILADQI